MRRFLQFNKMPLLLLFTAVLLYSSFAYDLVREDFIKLLTLYAGLFFLSWKLVQLKKKDFWFLATAAILLRLIFIVALPNLSQDFYRFIWDGRMLVAGWNPYLYLPEDLIASGTAPLSRPGSFMREWASLMAAITRITLPSISSSLPWPGFLRVKVFWDLLSLCGW
jgi:alpha-1,6-mannosyltransferase